MCARVPLCGDVDVREMVQECFRDVATEIYGGTEKDRQTDRNRDGK